jgi:hypothetical protein
LARFYTKKEARVEFKAEGVKTQYLEAWVITEAAKITSRPVNSQTCPSIHLPAVEGRSFHLDAASN